MQLIRDLDAAEWSRTAWLCHVIEGFLSNKPRPPDAFNPLRMNEAVKAEPVRMSGKEFVAFLAQIWRRR